MDYKETVFLPKTTFPMKAQLSVREPEILKKWRENDLYGRFNAPRGGTKFTLHDGPPYANGHLHVGHALGKILKDVINRSQRMLGRDVTFIPGWDCHGLPIEAKVEEELAKKGKKKDDIPVPSFRRACREFAEKWVAIQREEFKLLGVMALWDAPYKTSDFKSEAKIAGEILKFLMNGGLYKGIKPVMWSVVEQTALAEAEVEYRDKTSNSIHVKFPVAQSSLPDLMGASVVIWTTTPWTLPGNRAIAYGEDIVYALVKTDGGDRLLVAEDLLESATAAWGVDVVEVLKTYQGHELRGVMCRHPLHGQGYDFDVPLLPGDHVTLDAGTGFVHTAPGHGVEDFLVGKTFDLEVPQTVGGDGLFYDHVPLFAGLHVYKADGPVMEALSAAHALLAHVTIQHSYPHSWRSKKPLIYRTTPQWFISMEKNNLKAHALQAIEDVTWVPAIGKNRIQAMVENRPDWCLSRQRTWGVPLPLFVHKETGEPLRDAAVNGRILSIFEERGGDAWFDTDPQVFLGQDHRLADYEQVMDVADVWFDSASTHAFVLEGDARVNWPADLNVEGSDQHRGWFQTSLLESCGTRGKAPYGAVLTHGFLVDEQGYKMSKSTGNVFALKEAVAAYGADILRLWVVGSDYTQDVRFGPHLMKRQEDIYRRFRNTLKYLIGSLEGFQATEKVAYDDMPELEQCILHRLRELDQVVRQCNETYDFHDLYTQIHHFCAVDLSAFYFDIRKDAIYCDGVDSLKRRAARTVMDLVFRTVCGWLAPVLCFTTEEAWSHRYGADVDSIHLGAFEEIPASYHNPALAQRWEVIRQVRRVVTGALEIKRAEQFIGSSLQGSVFVYVSEDVLDTVGDVDMAEITITSQAMLTEGVAPKEAFTLEDVSGVAVVVHKAVGDKCDRCWRVLPEVGNHAHHPTLCGRCADTLERAVA